MQQVGYEYLCSSLNEEVNVVRNNNEGFLKFCDWKIGGVLDTAGGLTPIRQRQVFQYLHSKKGQGSTRNGRDSESKRRGIKKFDGEQVLAGNILVRQLGTKIHPGQNVGTGKDWTLFALKSGVVKYERYKRDKKRVSVHPLTLPTDPPNA